MHRSARATLLGLLLAPLPAIAESFTFSPNISSFPFAWHVVFDGGMSIDNPILHLIRGHSYDFVIAGNQSHPFYVKTVNGNGTLNGYSGFSPNGVATATTQTVSFLVPMMRQMRCSITARSIAACPARSTSRFFATDSAISSPLQLSRVAVARRDCPTVSCPAQSPSR